MKITIFDAGSGSCSLIVDVRGNSLQLDCGNDAEKWDPVDWIITHSYPGCWLDCRSWRRNSLGELVITNPNLENIKNSAKVHRGLCPEILDARRLEEFPRSMIAHGNKYLERYKNLFCNSYRQSPSSWSNTSWEFKYRKYSIPTPYLWDQRYFSRESFVNNSTIVCIIEYWGWKFLFGGDMEECGWNWLIDNCPDFKNDIQNDVHIMVQSHHGHVTGYSHKLMELMDGGPRLSVLSTVSGNCVSDDEGRYSKNSKGWPVYSMTTGDSMLRRSLSTVNNGIIRFSINPSDGDLHIASDE